MARAHDGSRRARVPAKVILAGEHGVVFGEHCLAAAVDLWLDVHLEPTDRGAPSLITVYDRGNHITTVAEDDAQSDFARAVRAILSELGIASLQGNLTVRSDFPPGAGLGFSAAFSVGLATLLAPLTGAAPDARRVDALALAAERVFHGTPSGVDSATVRAGHVVLFRTGHATPVALAWPLRILVVYTGAKSTARMVRAVARVQRGRPSTFARDVRRLGEIARALRVCLGEPFDAAAVAGLVAENQQILESFGLLTPRAREALALMAARGIRGKISGGGGGGIVIGILAPPREPDAASNLVAHFSARGFAAWVCRAE